jgi:hypothetical protein
MSDPIDDMIDFLEELNAELQKQSLNKGSHKCVRCSNSVSTKGGRCSSCLAKLKRAKKTPGSSQRAQTKADDALRRQDGKNGTASHKSKGRGTRASIVKQTQSAEKKTGQKLSPDRKNNGKGYAAKNTRMVPEKLNRGRHKVDPKKLSAWRKKVRKCNITEEDFINLLRAGLDNHSRSEELKKAFDTFTNEEIIQALDEFYQEAE